jgi:tRNA-2-methylthio-N6-dimethylallyladenosine synthase
MVGNSYRILVEGYGNMGGIKKWKGRTNCNRIVHFIPENDEQDLTWNWVDTKVTSATALSCQGELLKNYGRRLPPLNDRAPGIR